MSLPISADQNRTFTALMLAAFCSQSSIRLCDSMLPRLAHDFGGSAMEAAGVVTAFTIGYGLSQLMYGPLGDRYGKLRVITFATFAAALGSLACALALGISALTSTRFITGAACAALIPLSMAWIGDHVDYQNRQKALARFLAGSTSGLIFGQIAGGAFADTLGWRAAFGVVSLALAAVSVLLVLRLRAGGSAPAPSVTASPRPAAAASSSATPGAPARALSSMVRQFASVLSIGWARAILVFVLVEGALVFGATAFIPTFLNQQHGMALWNAGVVVAGFGAGGLSYALGSRWIVPALGERGLVAAGGLSFLAGISMIGGSNVVLEAVKCFFAGAGFFMLHNTLQTLATQMAPHARGTAISSFAFCLFLGQSLGVGAASRLVPVMGFPALFAGSGVLVAALAAALWAAIALRAQRGPA